MNYFFTASCTSDFCCNIYRTNKKCILTVNNALIKLGLHKPVIDRDMELKQILHFRFTTIYIPHQKATPYQLPFEDDTDTPAITERSAHWYQLKLMKLQHHPLHSITVIEQGYCIY